MKLSRPQLSIFLLLVGAVLASVCQPAPGQIAIPGNSQTEVTNIFLPAPRGLRQQLTRARKALEDQQYGDAVDLLGQLLASGRSMDDALENGGEQDYFLGDVEDGDTQLSLKSEAQRLLGAMPEKGRALYELKFGADARQLLDHALATRDVGQLVEVTRRYFHTEAGYEATMLLGRYHLDQGRPLAAALRFQRLGDTDFALRRYDPELSLLLATCWMLSDMPERARITLEGLQSRMPEAKLRIGAKEVSLFDPGDASMLESLRAVSGTDALPPPGLERVMAWLKLIIGPEITTRSQEATQWAMFRGNATRNAESAGGTPLLSPRWRVQTANHPTDEEILRQSRKQYLEQGVPVTPTIHPLAVADVIVMRSPRRLFGIDFETGKRIWEFPWFEAPDEDVLENDRIRPRQQLQHPLAMELSLRMWDDAPYGQMSSDEHQIFVLWGLASGNAQPSVLIQPFGIQRPNEAGSMDTNKLVSLDLKAQGKLRWIVGDEDGTDEPKLAGAFFLGAPLPLMGQLYALAEINGEIRLVVLDAESGALEWYQQLAHVDTRSISTDPGRRAAGASPSFSDGVLVCPTSSGAVVAVDVASRSLLWGYQYPLTGPRTRVGIATYRYNSKPMGERWADATVTISDGRVLVTPIETEKLYCLDLVSGTPVWEPLDRNDLLFVGCVYQGNAVLVGKSGVQAIALQDGKTQWQYKLEAGMPSGRGMLTGAHYYLPTTANRLLKIDVSNGKVVEDIETDATLGNLIAYKDQILSQNVDWLAAYYQTEPLRKMVAGRLQADAKDSWALARKAELLLHDGKHGEALEIFQLAHRLNPEDDAIRSSLVRSLLSALRDDFQANRGYAAELETMISQPEEMTDFCRWMAVGLKQQGDYEKATEYFIRLASMESPGDFGRADSSSTDMVRVDSQLKVHRSRWLRVQIEQLLTEVDGEARESIDRMIRSRLDEVVQSGSISKLNLFVEHFGSHKFGIEARLQLARLLLDQTHWVQAELELIELQRIAEPATATTATALLAQMLLRNGCLEEAAACADQLAGPLANYVSIEGQTGAQLAAATRDHEALRTWLEKRTQWLYGKCETTRQDQRALASYQRVFPIDLDEVRGPFPRHWTLIYNQNQNALLLGDALGKTVQQVALGDQNRFVTTTNAAAGRASAHGHLLVANVGFEVMAIDTLRGANEIGEVVLWRNDLSSNLMMVTNRTRQLMPKTTPRKWGPPRIALSDTSRQLIGVTGPVTRLGVVYQKMHDLTCADPLTGETVWLRSGIEPGSDIFGDEQYTFVVAPDESEALVLRTADGTEVGQRPVTSRAERWVTFGRNVVTCRSDGKNLTIRCFDAWEQQDLWNRSLHDDTQCWRPSRDELAMLDPLGNFQIVDPASGRAVVECQLEPQEDLKRLYVLPSASDYCVIAGGEAPSDAASATIYGSIGGDLCPNIFGQVYCIDRQTGAPRWTEPARIQGYCVPLDQPADAPAIVFLQNSRVPVSPDSNRTTYKASVVFLDKRDGRELYSADGLERMVNYSVEADPSKQTVVVRTNAHEFTMQFTDTPIEPARPFQMKVEQSSSSKALENVSKIAGAILDAITDQGNAAKKDENGTNKTAKDGGDAKKDPPAPAPETTKKQ